MNSREELNVLRQLSKLLTDEERERKSQKTRRRLVYSVAFFALVAAFMPFMMQGELIGLVAAAVAALAGSLVGFAIYGEIAARQWPILKPHINVESVSTRIMQL
jgi:sorbitol-specific phosphotransferase system component IIBC